MMMLALKDLSSLFHILIMTNSYVISLWAQIVLKIRCSIWLGFIICDLN
jgi:hypothetical protein